MYRNRDRGSAPPRHAARVGLGLLLVGLLALGGCAANLENAAKILAERDPSTCQLPVDGKLLEFTGPVCEQAASGFVSSLRYQVCANSNLDKDSEKMCIFALAMERASGGDGGGTSNDLRFLAAAMAEDGKDRRQLRGLIANGFMFGMDRYLDHKDSQDYNDFLTALGTRPSNVNITKSDDGGGSEGGGRGGDGDQFVYIGDHGQTINRAEGSAISDGRNPTFLGLNRPDSSFETSNANNNEAPGATNNNGSAVSNSDDDGGQSLVPDFLP